MDSSSSGYQSNNIPRMIDQDLPPVLEDVAHDDTITYDTSDIIDFDITSVSKAEIAMFTVIYSDTDVIFIMPQLPTKK